VLPLTDMKKQASRFPYLLVGGLTIVAGIGIYFVASAWDRPQRVGETPSDILRRSGYLEIRPATDVGGPGTLITIDVKTNDYVMLHPTCNMDWREVSGLWQTSPTSDTEIAHQLEGEFKLGAEALRNAGFDLSANAVRALHIKFQNTKVVWLSDETRMDLGSRYLKDNCLKAVVQVSSKDKKCVTQPISAMQADVAYRVEFSDGVAASEKAKVLGGVSGTLTGSGAATGNDSIVGKNLFVGLKLNGWCIVPNDGQPGASVASLPTAVSVPTR
jgi:hypothetical protein